VTKKKDTQTLFGLEWISSVSGSDGVEKQQQESELEENTMMRQEGVYKGILSHKTKG